MENIEKSLKKATGLDVKTFIEKLNNAEWKYVSTDVGYQMIEDEQGLWFVPDGGGAWVEVFIEKILLDPSAWRAVGRVEGWNSIYDMASGIKMEVNSNDGPIMKWAKETGTVGTPEPEYKHHQFITNLWEYGTEN